MVLGTEMLGRMAVRRIVARGELMVGEWGSVLEREGGGTGTIVVDGAGQRGAGGFHVKDGLP